jgi:hypothetical protein
LVSVDVLGKTFVIRVENGMEQTFQFDDNTEVMGLEGQSRVRNLIGKEGSELAVQFQNDGDDKIATRVDVTQVITGAKRVGRRHKK